MGEARRMRKSSTLLSGTHRIRYTTDSKHIILQSGQYQLPVQLDRELEHLLHCNHLS